MKFFLRFTSSCEYGFGLHADGIGMIYSYVLQKHGVDFYNDIAILQCADDVGEFVMFRGKNNVDINIKYPGDKDFEEKSYYEKSLLQLTVIHEALIRLAKKDERLSIEKLNAVREEILKNEFSFEIPYKRFPNKKNKDLIATIIVHPENKAIKTFSLIEVDKREKCKVLLYNGRPDTFFLHYFFKYAKWVGLNKVIISGEVRDIEFHVSVDGCELGIVNLSKYEKHPQFELNKADITESEKEVARKNWLNSLPLDIAEAVEDETYDDTDEDGA